jgi:[acyl-carrier-protein] S-malonyltransferase
MAQMWKVVGGSEVGGILVRTEKDLKSPEATPNRVSNGAILQELELQGSRLKFRLAEGRGPQEGWVSLALKDKALVEKTDYIPVASPAAVGGDMAPCALLFPGQGSQYVGMLKEMKDVPAVKEMLEKSKEILGWDVLDLCLNGPEEKLAETRYTQPCMFIGGLAGQEKLRATKAEHAGKPMYVAGLSLGEYTALCSAGVFTFEDGLKLVKLRGEAMQEAAEMGGKQAMLSVAGLDSEKLAALCAEAQQEEGVDATCSISNALFPNGFSCGGTEKAINILKEKAEKAGALQAKVLKTGGAFHTALMQPAQTKLNEALELTRSKMSPPTSNIFMNATAEMIPVGSSVDKIVENLQKQLTNNVLWEPSVKAMIRAGCTQYYECGPMKQLKAMMKRIDQKVWKTTENIDV